LEAIAAAESFKPELVLLDIGLPHMDGYAVAKHLRQQASSRDIVLAALTGYGDDDDRRRSREAGFNYHFVKPMEFAILNELLEQMDAR
jgi:CheY-like chemotaxis protein